MDFEDEDVLDEDDEYNEENEYNEAECLECGGLFIQETDIQLCWTCAVKFDLKRLWKMHDNNELDALDFNERKSLRESLRLEIQRKLE